MQAAIKPASSGPDTRNVPNRCVFTTLFPCCAVADVDVDGVGVAAVGVTVVENNLCWHRWIRRAAADINEEGKTRREELQVFVDNNAAIENILLWLLTLTFIDNGVRRFGR